MARPELTDSELLRSLTFLERRYTPEGLKANLAYQTLLRKAIDRNLRLETLTEEQQLVRIEVEGPGFNRES